MEQRGRHIEDIFQTYFLKRKTGVISEGTIIKKSVIV